jgi:enoyl-CoA hydratase/carnithine racemase
MLTSGADLDVAIDDRFVATVEIRRGPENSLDAALLESVVEIFCELDGDPRCRAIVLCSSGKHFCTGAKLVGADSPTAVSGLNARIYAAAGNLMMVRTPVVAAVQGAAIGGGLGLALTADFRVAGKDARFAAAWAKLGLHHGFGLSVTLPEVVGRQRAMELLLTGRRISAAEALAIGLCDRLTEAGAERDGAIALAAEMAENAPLAVTSMRATLRGDLVDRFRAATECERAAQDLLQGTEDHAEGLRASTERRSPHFVGR